MSLNERKSSTYILCFWPDPSWVSQSSELRVLCDVPCPRSLTPPQVVLSSSLSIQQFFPLNLMKYKHCDGYSSSHCKADNKFPDVSVSGNILPSLYACIVSNMISSSLHFLLQVSVQNTIYISLIKKLYFVHIIILICF